MYIMVYKVEWYVLNTVFCTFHGRVTEISVYILCDSVHVQFTREVIHFTCSRCLGQVILDLKHGKTVENCNETVSSQKPSFDGVDFSLWIFTNTLQWFVREEIGFVCNEIRYMRCLCGTVWGKTWKRAKRCVL